MRSKEIRKTVLIGANIEIVKARNKNLVGLKGKIVDETRNIIRVDVNGKEKSIVKEQVVLHIYKNNRKYEVPGRLLIGRIEERIKNET